MEFTYYKIIFIDPVKKQQNRIIWDYDYLIEQINYLEEQGEKFIVNKYTESEVYNFA